MKESNRATSISTSEEKGNNGNNDQQLIQLDKAALLKAPNNTPEPSVVAPKQSSVTKLVEDNSKCCTIL